MFIPLLTLFVNPFLIKEFTPIKNEIQKKIDYKLPLEETNILKKINGFYGQIGPNPNYYDNDYHLFDGNGMIHGIFFDNGTITSAPVNKFEPYVTRSGFFARRCFMIKYSSG